MTGKMLTGSLIEYDCTLFHRKVWVTTSEKDLQDRFVYDDDKSVPIVDADTLEAAVLGTLEEKEERHLGFGVWLSEASDISSCVHESIHVASNIFKAISAEHDFNNEETYAYLVEWVFECLYEALQKLLPQNISSTLD